MNLPNLPTIQRLADRQLYRALSSILGVLRIRFYSGPKSDEQVVLWGDLKPILSAIDSGFDSSFTVVSDVRLTDGVLEKKLLTVDIEKGEVVNFSESEWGA